MELLNVPISRANKRRLERLALKTKRSTSYLAADAIKGYLEYEERVIDQILEGIKQADEGNFADPKDVDAIFKKWRLGVSKAPKPSKRKR